MTPHFLFTHGWGLDASLWDGVRAELGDPGGSSVRELGYFGPAFEPLLDDGPVIAVGHSLGVMQTLAEPPPGLVGLVAVNGFTRFSAAPDHPGGVPARLLRRMRQRLDQDPDATVIAFRVRCGLGSPLPGAARLQALAGGLDQLCDGDARQRLRHLPVPVLALAGRQDGIVPPALSLACFGEIRWVEAAAHLLPLSHPAFCATALQAFADGLG